mgnify:CR=1 FL=1
MSVIDHDKEGLEIIHLSASPKNTIVQDWVRGVALPWRREGDQVRGRSGIYLVPAYTDSPLQGICSIESAGYSKNQTSVQIERDETW